VAKNVDNAQGAPTVGLGQNVTFAFEPGSAVPQQQAAQQARVRGGSQGSASNGRISQGQGVERQPVNPLVALVGKFATGVIDNQLKKVKQENFMAGMQAAAAGKAVKEIADEAPWYSTLFGEADAVEGARQYSALTRSSEAISTMERELPETRKLGADAARKHYVERMNGAMTGDTPTDSAIMQSMVKQMPHVLTSQAKAHYGYQQEVATANEATAFAAGATLLRDRAATLARDPDSPSAREAWDATTGEFIRSIQPVNGRDITSWRDSITSNIRGLAAQGNFYAVNALRDKGLIEAMSPDQQRQIESAVEAGEARVRSRYTDQWADRMGQIEAQAVNPMPGQTVPQIVAQAEAVNKEYRDLTGSRLGLFSRENLTALAKGSAGQITRMKERAIDIEMRNAEVRARRAERLADRAERLAEKKSAAEIVNNVIAANPQYAQALIDQGVAPRTAVIAYWSTQYEAAGTPEQKYAVQAAIFKSGIALPGVAQTKQAPITAFLADPQVAQKNPASILAMVADFDNHMAIGGPEMAQAYYGDYAPVMHAMSQQMRVPGANPAVAAQVAAQTAMRPTQVKLDGDGKKALSKEVKELTPPPVLGFIPAWVVGQKSLNDSSRRTLERAAEGHVARYTALGMSPEAAAKAGIAAATTGDQATVTVMGQYAWTVPSGEERIDAYLRKGQDGGKAIEADDIDTVLDDAIEGVLYGEYKDGVLQAGVIPQDGMVFNSRADDMTIYQTQVPKAGGGTEPQLAIYTVVGDKPRIAYLRASDIVAQANKQRDRRKKATASSSAVPFGNLINMK
jgi:hypothetical protein